MARTRTPVKRAASKKAATKSSKVASKADTSRGPVLIKKSIKQIKAFIGDDEDIEIRVSRKSLVDARTANARSAAAKALEESS